MIAENYQWQVNSNTLDWKNDRDKSEGELFEKAEKYLFGSLGLPQQKFTKQNAIHREYKCQVNISGDAEWFEPTYALSFSLKNSLTEEELKNYVILYHGVKNNSSVKPILETSLKAGTGQAYSSKPSKNPEKKVPSGIYASQFMNTTLGYVDRSFPIVLQVAAPSHVVTSRKDYIVVQKAIALKLICPFTNAPRQTMQ